MLQSPAVSSDMDAQDVSDASQEWCTEQHNRAPISHLPANARKAIDNW